MVTDSRVETAESRAADRTSLQVRIDYRLDSMPIVAQHYARGEVTYE